MSDTYLYKLVHSVIVTNSLPTLQYLNIGIVIPKYRYCNTKKL